MLHYLEPPDILSHIEKGDHLPNFITNTRSSNNASLNILLAANAFDIDSSVPESLREKFSKSCADVIAANPPWGDPDSEDTEAVDANNIALHWCSENDYPVGDEDRSQTFIWKAVDLLRPEGIAALLVSTAMLFNHSHPTVEFRNKFFKTAMVDSIFNFAHTRRYFFKASNSPFMALIFKKTGNIERDHRIHYWSAKRTANIESLQSVILSRNDLKLIKQSDATKEHIWKIYWWGGYRDEALFRYLDIGDRLNSFTQKGLYRRGFQEGNKSKDSDWLMEYKELPTDKFQRYGGFNASLLVEPPKRVEARGFRELYEGPRLLIKRGITEHSVPKGTITARYETDKFCFRNSIHGVKLSNADGWLYKCILGILWSSLMRYYIFLSSSTWGIWHHEIHLDELLDLPIRLPENNNLKEEIVNIVDKLRDFIPNETELVLSNNPATDRLKELESKLDNAVFRLYELDESEIDLINDLCGVGIEYFYLGSKSVGSKALSTNSQAIQAYLKAFSEIWNRELDKETEFSYEVIIPQNGIGMLAIIFRPCRKGDLSSRHVVTSDLNRWNELLKDESLFTYPLGSSKIYVDGIVRVVTDKEIVIIKRNETRLWTRSMAREDAEATLVRAINRKSM